MAICRCYDVPCILHSFMDAAIALGADAIHLPLPLLREMTAEQRTRFAVLGASCHSLADVREAEALGCTYITAGHIFATDCKKGLPGRGLDFLRQVCAGTTLPVYAIGGIAADNIDAVRGTGAAGACVMSGMMRCADPAAYLRELERRKP